MVPILKRKFFVIATATTVYQRTPCKRNSLPSAYAVEVMFSSCVCVFVCVCVSVCLSVHAITFEGVDIETSFFGMVLDRDNI